VLGRVPLIAAALTLAATGCGTSAPPADDAADTASPTPSTTPSPTAETIPGEPVTLRAADGIRISGRVFGHGLIGVVFGHQSDGDQRDWWDFAELLGGQSYRALTVNFRSYCPRDGAGCSGDGTTGDAWLDLAAGVTWLRDHGARRVVLIGASMGGLAVVVAAAHEHVDGVVALSAPIDCCGLVADRAALERAHTPMLFIAGRFDGDAAGSARTFARWASPSGTAVILGSGEHGVDLTGGLATPQIERRTTDLILDFLGRVRVA
jgi:pimeloyl-ACP methyl ester carboxylesterase